MPKSRYSYYLALTLKTMYYIRYSIPKFASERFKHYKEIHYKNRV